MCPAQGWALGISWGTKPGTIPALLEPTVGQTVKPTADLVQITTPVNLSLPRRQAVRTGQGSHSCAGPGRGAGLVEQGGLTWDRNGESEGSSLGGETAPGQRAGHQPVAGIERTGRRPSRGPETEDVRGCGRWAECSCHRIIKGQSLGASAIAIPSPQTLVPSLPQLPPLLPSTNRHRAR